MVARVHNFGRLQELDLVVNWPGFIHEVLLSSITSVELRKIIFRAEYMYERAAFAWRMKEWVVIDKQLCGLVDRLRAMGYCRTLEAELRLVKTEEDPGTYRFTKFLPKFREKGVATITYGVHGDRLLHSSTYCY